MNTTTPAIQIKPFRNMTDEDRKSFKRKMVSQIASSMQAISSIDLDAFAS